MTAEAATPRPLALSVIVPAYASAELLRRCLDGLVASDLPRAQWECIVVDDGSRDHTSTVATPIADQVLRVADGPRGPAHARNLGAAAARGTVLVFVDADVVVAPSTLRGFRTLFDADPALTAAFGAYDEHPGDPGFVSQYRNLLHRWVHLRHAGAAETFWTGCGAVRRADFLALGGFDANRYPRPQVEDIEFGYRLRDRGGRIELVPSLEATHLKRWTLRRMLRTDLLDRAIPWMQLLLERDQVLHHGPLNLARTEQVLTVAAAVVVPSAIAAALTLTPAWFLVVAICLAVLLAGNMPFLRWLALRRGVWFAARCLPLRVLFHMCSAIGASWAMVTYPLKQPRPTARRSAYPAAVSTRARGVIAFVGAALLVLHAALAWATRVPGLTIGNDDAAYLSLARALQGGRYVELWTAGLPVHAKYPPGYPALLALIGATGPEGIGIAVLASIALSTAALAGAALMASRLSPWMAIPVLLVCAPNPMLVSLAGSVHSEPLFSALLFGTLLLLSRSRGSTRDVAVVGSLAVLAALTRSIGVALLGAVLVELMMRRQWRRAAVLTVFSACTVGVWLTWTVRAPRANAGYVADALYVEPTAGASSGVPAAAERAPVQLSDPSVGERAAPSLLYTIARRATVQVPAYLTQYVPAALSQPTIPGTLVDNIAGLMLLLVAGGTGVGVLARRHRSAVLLLLLYGGVLVFWPWSLMRFVAPVLPLVVLAIMMGLLRLGARSGSSRGGWIAVWSVSLLLAMSAVAQARHRLAEIGSCERQGDAITAPGCSTPVQRSFFAAVDALPPASADSSPILASKASTVFLRSGRRAARKPEALAQGDPDALLAWLRAEGVRTVLLSRLSFNEWGMAPALEARCEAFTVQATTGSHTALLQLEPAASVAEGDGDRQNACEMIRAWASGDWEAEARRAPLALW